MSPTTCERFKGQRIRVETTDGLVRIGWCQGACAHDTRLMLDRLTSISLVRLTDVASVSPAPLRSALVTAA